MEILHCSCFNLNSFYSVCCLVTALCLILCNPVDGRPPGSSVHGISQARTLEWVAVPFSGDLPNPGTEPTSPELQVNSLPLSYLRIHSFCSTSPKEFYPWYNYLYVWKFFFFINHTITPWCNKSMWTQWNFLNFLWL